MSAHLREALVPAVWQELQRLSHGQSHDYTASDAEIVEAIKTAFRSLDKAVVDDAASAVQSNDPMGEVIARLKLGSSGSCALLAMHDPETGLLRTACVGDSRAVVGRRNPETGAWTSLPQTVDQTGSNKNEVARINSEHPGEDDIVKDGPGGGRVLGIMVSRAFGDGFWKWDADTQKKIASTYFNGGYAKEIPFAGLKTPPYLTAEPIVTKTEVVAGDFLIMASDGFWDHVSSEQAVELVRRWIEWKDAGMSGKVTGTGKTAEEQKINRLDEWRWSWHDGVLAIEDDNAATHLARNTLGGADDSFLQAVFGYDPPRSRNIRCVLPTTVEAIADKYANKRRHHYTGYILWQLELSGRIFDRPWMISFGISLLTLSRFLGIL
jgi:pyruvate dehydrogenase phosphatase